MTSDPLGRHAEHAGFGGVPSDMTFDAERDRPGRVHALERLCPDIRRIMAGLRQTLPVAPTAAEGEDTITAWCRLFARLLGHTVSVFAVSIVGQLLIETTRSRHLPRLRLRPVLHEHPRERAGARGRLPERSALNVTTSTLASASKSKVSGPGIRGKPR